MAKRSREELARIVERDLPGYALAEPEASPDSLREVPPQAAEQSPDIEQFRRKYLAEDDVGGHGGLADASDPAENEADSVDDEIITVRPSQAADPFDHSARPKTVIISGEDGRIIGSQG